MASQLVEKVKIAIRAPYGDELAHAAIKAVLEEIYEPEFAAQLKGRDVFTDQFEGHEVRWAETSTDDAKAMWQTMLKHIARANGIELEQEAGNE